LRGLAEACRQLSRVYGDPSEFEAKNLVAGAGDAERLRVLCANALFEAGEDVAKSAQLFDSLGFTERCVTPESIPLKRPASGNLATAAKVLETAVRVLGRKHGLPQSKAETAKVTGGLKRGPQARDHQEIADIARRHHPWKNCLDEVCAQLDAEEVPMPKPWRRWKSKPKTWEDALADDQSRVIKSIENSLKQVRKAHPV
jgi:hypothetical protein